MRVPPVFANGNLPGAGGKPVIHDGDDVTIAAPGRAAARNLHLRQRNRGFAAQQQDADLGKDAPATVAAMHKPVAIAGLSAPLPLKPQNRPRFRLHSNHHTLGTPPSRKDAVLHRRRL